MCWSDTEGEEGRKVWGVRGYPCREVVMVCVDVVSTVPRSAASVLCGG